MVVPDDPIVLKNTEDDTLTLTRTSSKAYEIRTEGLGMFVHINIMATHIIVDIQVPSAKCCDYAVLGLCGPCQECFGSMPQPGAVVPDPTDGRDDIIGKIKQVRIDVDKDVIFRGDETSYPAGLYAGYCLAFKESAVIIENLRLSFTQYTCVEFFIKTCAEGCGGTIFSYAASKTFFLSTIHGYITIHYGNFNITTDLYLGIEVWNFISLIWDSNSLTLNVYIFDVAGLPTRRTYLLPDDIFPSDGSLCIGAWQPGFDGTGFEPVGTFVGVIDELRLWDR